MRLVCRRLLVLGLVLLSSTSSLIAQRDDAQRDDAADRAASVIRGGEIFGTDENIQAHWDFISGEFSTGDGPTYISLLGNVVITGDGFELHADAVGFFIDGFDEEQKPIAPRVFATGSILLTRGDQSFRAETMFFDVERQRAILTDMRLRITQSLVERLRQTPIHDPQRARDILSAFGPVGEFPSQDQTIDESMIVFAAEELTVEDFERIEGTGIQFTTSEFGDPEWALEARAGRAEERQEVRKFPGETDPGGWRFSLDGVALRAGPVKLPLLPGIVWDSRWGRYIPIRSVSYSSSGKYGNRIDTVWNGNLLLPGVLAREVDLGVRVDYLSERGTGFGADLEWGRDPLRWATIPDGRLELYGTGQYWAIEDRGTDRNGTTPSSESRYRSRFHQRMRLQTGTLIDFEYASESDDNFLNEFYEEEARGEKTPENIIFVRQGVTGSGQISILYQRQVVDYRSVLERLPEMRFAWIEEEIAESGFFLDADALVGRVEDRPAEDLLLPTRENQRADVRLELTRPVAIARGLRLRPFIEGRYTYWDEDITGDEEDRVAWAGGATLSSRVWRTFGTQIPALKIDGLKHIVDFDITFESLFDTNVTPSELLVLDALEQIDERESVTLGLYQRLFTRTRLDGVEADRGYAVRSVADARLEIEWFPEKERDNSGESWGPLQGEILLTPFEKLGFFVDGDVNFQDGDVEEWNSGVRWYDPSRFVFEVASRRRRQLQESLVLGGRVWASERYEFGAFAEFDLRRNETVNQRYEIVRNFHTFSAAFSIEVDEGEDDNTTFRVNFGPRDLLGRRRGTDPRLR